MTDRVKRFLDYYNKREYRKLRLVKNEDCTDQINEKDPLMFSTKGLELICSKEKPLLYTADDLFGFNRYNANLPVIVGYNDKNEGQFYNITVDYESALEKGISGITDDARQRYATADDIAKNFYDAMFLVEKICLNLTELYRNFAVEQGNDQLAKALETVPMRGATSYYEALITIKFIQFILRLNRNKHITIGRFDKYMKPYFDMSIKAGQTIEELTELTELWFIAMNFDADIYEGIQQGDNGQSMVLGGYDENGIDIFNDLSEVCLHSSEELSLIDPKINLRVNKDTPLALYERATRLTKQGLGFPQYNNDDVVIDGLVQLGYDLRDARDYTVAACWEFIIPRCGTEIPNIGVMNFPLMVERATQKSLATCETFDEFFQKTVDEIKDSCDWIVDRYNKRRYPHDALLSMLILPCVETGREIYYNGAKYRNFGIHGAGLSTAADTLSAIKTVVFDEKSVSVDELLDALKADFVGYETLQKKLLACPKMGNNEDLPDKLGGMLLDAFAKNLNGRKNGVGGIYRAGTGSAMEYVLSARRVGATADGRKAQAPFGSSFSPSLNAKLNGPLSAIQSFTKYDMKNVINGGPFTIEIHDTVFRNDEGEKKVAMLVKTFIDLGGHQIQINAINREKLLDAQAHPEKYPGLIVRVWGWSGYFNELDVEYQNHVIARTEFTV